jgi:hypothetical protein
MRFFFPAPIAGGIWLKSIVPIPVSPAAADIFKNERLLIFDDVFILSLFIVITSSPFILFLSGCLKTFSAGG